MATTGQYSGLNAKVRAMRGHLLRTEDYESLAQSQNVEDFGHRLYEYPAYARALSDMYDKALHRGVIEQKLVLALADDFSRIYSFVGNHRLREYLNAFYLRHEIEILKLLLCAVYDERPAEYTLPELAYLLGKTLRVDVAGLVSAKTVDAFIAQLQGTAFHNVLARHLGGETPSLFSLEMSLDLYYFMHKRALQEKYLNPVNKRVMTFLNGTEMDLQNILWAYRLKTYYNVSEARIYTCLIPFRYRLSKAALMRIVEAQTPEVLRSEILTSPYGQFFAGGVSIDEGCRAAMHRAFRKAKRLYPNTLATATAYLHDKETEIRNVVSLMESIRYGLHRDEALAFLMMPG